MYEYYKRACGDQSMQLVRQQEYQGNGRVMGSYIRLQLDKARLLHFFECFPKIPLCFEGPLHVRDYPLSKSVEVAFQVSIQLPAPPRPHILAFLEVGIHQFFAFFPNKVGRRL